MERAGGGRSEVWKKDGSSEPVSSHRWRASGARGRAKRGRLPVLSLDCPITDADIPSPKPASPILRASPGNWPRRPSVTQKSADRPIEPTSRLSPNSLLLLSDPTAHSLCHPPPAPPRMSNLAMLARYKGVCPFLSRTPASQLRSFASTPSPLSPAFSSLSAQAVGCPVMGPAMEKVRRRSQSCLVWPWLLGRQQGGGQRRRDAGQGPFSSANGRPPAPPACSLALAGASLVASAFSSSCPLCVSK